MREQDIRPAEIYAELLRLAAVDADAIFDHSQSRQRACPACGGTEAEPAFVKSGFTFCECALCGTLFANPLPPPPQFETFYRDGQSAHYWADVFVPRVMETRREAIVRPRVARIREICRGRGVVPATVVDIGAGHGMFLEEWRRQMGKVRGLAVEPNAALAARCRDLGFEVYEGVGERAGERWRNTADLATCFEVMEHVPDLVQFVTSINTMLRPGGVAVMTTLGCDGFDVRVLWRDADCICPPSHINFCSRTGFIKLFERAGFSDVEVMTPGELDVDIVRNKLAKSDLPVSRFERLLLASGEDVLRDFQDFLRRHRLSSHSWVVAQKPGNG